ncbi:MAG TPA: hypothetical protein VL306_00555 [Methylomirabilota bacterium]|jgi:hypothetical protein|nr:hypothetical protein [Methylomirabilota bacterium]
MELLSVSPREEAHPAIDPVIPSVRGKFYSYRTDFSLERPLGYLMDCKANKRRPLSFAEDNPEGLDLVFTFDHRVVEICSPKSRPARWLLRNAMDARLLSATTIGHVDITPEEFYQIRLRKNGAELAEVCRKAMVHNYQVMGLTPNCIVAVVTESGKYGLFLVKELTHSTVTVDACHILL